MTTYADLQAILDQNKGISSEAPLVAAIQSLLSNRPVGQNELTNTAFTSPPHKTNAKGDIVDDGIACLKMLYCTDLIDLASHFLALNQKDLESVRKVLSGVSTNHVIIGNKATVISLARLLKSKDKADNMNALIHALDTLMKRVSTQARDRCVSSLFHHLDCIQQIDKALTRLGDKSQSAFEMIMIEPEYADELAQAYLMAEGKTDSIIHTLPPNHPQFAHLLARGLHKLLYLRDSQVGSLRNKLQEEILLEDSRLIVKMQTHPYTAYDLARCLESVFSAPLSVNEKLKYVDGLIVLLSRALEGTIEGTDFTSEKKCITLLEAMDCEPAWYLLALIYHDKLTVPGVKTNLAKAHDYYRLFNVPSSPWYDHAQEGLFELLLLQLNLSAGPSGQADQEVWEEFKKIGEYLVFKGYKGVATDMLNPEGKPKELFTSNPLFSAYADRGEKVEGNKRSIGVQTPQFFN